MQKAQGRKEDKSGEEEKMKPSVAILFYAESKNRSQKPKSKLKSQKQSNNLTGQNYGYFWLQVGI